MICSVPVGRLEVASMCVSCGNGPMVRWKLAVKERDDGTPLKNREEDIPAVPRGSWGGGGRCRYSFPQDGDIPSTGFSFHM